MVSSHSDTSRSILRETAWGIDKLVRGQSLGAWVDRTVYSGECLPGEARQVEGRPAVGLSRSSLSAVLLGSRPRSAG